MREQQSFGIVGLTEATPVLTPSLCLGRDSPCILGDQLPHRVVGEHRGALRDAGSLARLRLQVLARDGHLLRRRVAGQPDDLPKEPRSRPRIVLEVYDWASTGCQDHQEK